MEGNGYSASKLTAAEAVALMARNSAAKNPQNSADPKQIIAYLSMAALNAF